MLSPAEAGVLGLHCAKLLCIQLTLEGQNQAKNHLLALPNIPFLKILFL